MIANVFSVLALAGAAQAHMSMFYPPPLGAAPSINKQSTAIDKEFNYPLGCCGSTGGSTNPSPGICRGYLDRFDVETASVTWQAGQDAQFQLTDYSYDPNAPGSTHSGGSCQVGFSVDKGATWKVAASYHGACPKHTEDGSPEAQTFDFKVPTGMPNGDALFAWVWLNREHEAFMNCAKVNIQGGSGTANSTTPSAPASSTAPKTPTSSGSGSSGTTPKTPSQSSSSGTTPKQPQTPSQTTPDDEDESDDESSSPLRPISSSRAGRPARPTGTGRSRHHHSSARPSSTSRPARPSSDDDDSDDSSSSSSDSSSRPHKQVNANSRKYNVDGWNCECRRETLNSRCYCDSDSDDASSSEKRAAVEKKALRMHRRTLYKRVDACDWASAPSMEVSYYTEDAKCAPNAKTDTPSSDNFELSWNVNCGAVTGDGEYPLKVMSCGGSYSASIN